MFEVSRGGALGVFRSCRQTKAMVTSSSSMFSNRITCLDEPSGEKNKNTVICILGSQYGRSSANKQLQVQVRLNSAFTQLQAKFKNGSINSHGKDANAARTESKRCPH